MKSSPSFIWESCMKKTILIDTSALLHRAKHSIGNTLSYKDIKTGILFGFFLQIHKLAFTYKTNRFVFCLDSKSSLRKKIYPDYKSSRKKEKTALEQRLDDAAYSEFDKISGILTTLGFKNVFQFDGYESDDCIASFIIHNKSLRPSILIGSSDKDFYQLLGKCRGMILMSKNSVYSRKHFEEEYGVKPIEWKIIRSYSGCNSDSVPGIPGVGEKTAAKFIRGELTKGKVYDKIVSGDFDNVCKLAYKLTALPYHGTPECLFTEDCDSLNFDGFLDVCSAYNFQSIINNGDTFNGWKKFFSNKL